MAITKRIREKLNKLIESKLDSELQQFIKSHPNELSAAFTALDNANIPFEDDQELCLAVINNVYITEISDMFGWHFNHYTINNNFSKELASEVKALKEAEIPFVTSQKLCLAIVKHQSSKLPEAFAALREANIPYSEKTLELYLAAIEYANYAESFPIALKVLIDANLPFSENTLELYRTAFRLGFRATELPEVFESLKKAGINYTENKSFYDGIIDNVLHDGYLKYIIWFMGEIGITYNQYPQFFHISTLSKGEQIIEQIGKKLFELGIKPNAHLPIYIKLFEMITEEKGLTEIASIFNRLFDYVNENGLCSKNDNNYKKQQEKFDSILNESNIDSFASLTYGPLNKSDETKQIEKILEQISDPQIFEKTQMFYRDEHYFIKLPDQDEINLSILIKNANLSHLTLSDELIEKIGSILKRVLKKWEKPNDNNAVVKLLSSAQRKAIETYKGQEYKNINALFRSEALDLSHPAFIAVNEKNKEKIVHANFLLGCILNDAANKISVLAADTNLDPKRKEKVEKLNSKNDILDRQEDLTSEVKARRVANPSSFPALTSFSLFTNGTSIIAARKNVHTKLENARGYNINKAEGEVLFPHGTQVVTKRINDDYFVSTMVCSPSLERNHYWSDLVLKHVWDNHLRHAYKDKDSRIQNVLRPNHGLAHTYRVMQSTDLVAHYFAQFANDNEFKEFCQSLTPEDKEWLRIAAAFSVTGRESEVAALEDLETYERYRKASADNFTKFIDTTSLSNKTAMKDAINDVVCNMGHPDYENKINKNPDEAERKRRNFLNRLLSSAHKLDLARCYNVSKFSSCLKYILDYSIKTPEQLKAFNELISYQIQVLKAHGNALNCDIQFDGTLVDVNRDYQPIFEDVSHSMKRLFEVTETVSRPLILLPFQYAIEAVPTLEFKRKLTEKGSSAKRLKINRPQDLVSTEMPKHFELQVDNPKKRIIQSSNEQSSKRKRRIGIREMTALTQAHTNGEPKQPTVKRTSFFNS